MYRQLPDSISLKGVWIIAYQTTPGEKLMFCIHLDFVTKTVLVTLGVTLAERKQKEHQSCCFPWTSQFLALSTMVSIRISHLTKTGSAYSRELLFCHIAIISYFYFQFTENCCGKLFGILAELLSLHIWHFSFNTADILNVLKHWIIAWVKIKKRSSVQIEIRNIIWGGCDFLFQYGLHPLWEFGKAVWSVLKTQW